MTAAVTPHPVPAGWQPVSKAPWTERHRCLGTCRNNTRHLIVGWSEYDGMRWLAQCVRCLHRREVR